MRNPGGVRKNIPSRTMCKFFKTWNNLPDKKMVLRIFSYFYQTFILLGVKQYIRNISSSMELLKLFSNLEHFMYGIKFKRSFSPFVSVCVCVHVYVCVFMRVCVCVCVCCSG